MNNTETQCKTVIPPLVVASSGCSPKKGVFLFPLESGYQDGVADDCRKGNHLERTLVRKCSRAAGPGLPHLAPQASMAWQPWAARLGMLCLVRSTSAHTSGKTMRPPGIFGPFPRGASGGYGGARSAPILVCPVCYPPALLECQQSPEG